MRPPVKVWDVVLVGNFEPDGQISMLRYAEALEVGLKERGHRVYTCSPQPFFFRLRKRARGVNKWLGYLDKYIIFPFVLRKRLAEIQKLSRTMVIHICDHSNALYYFYISSYCTIVTCHDAGAVKGALGMLPDCPATYFGKLLQSWISAGLRRVDAIACVTKFSAQELDSLVMKGVKRTVRVVYNGFNRDFESLKDKESRTLLSPWPALAEGRRYVLTVGSGLRRKNRAIVLQVLKKVWVQLECYVVIAGESLDEEILGLARDLGIADRVIEVSRPDDWQLQALYRNAYALLFPSRYEGFGWPIIEAQICGCPVLCGDNSAQPEVAGSGAWFRDSEDVEGFASDLIRLENSDVRRHLVELGYLNARRFSMDKVVDSMEKLYGEVWAD